MKRKLISNSIENPTISLTEMSTSSCIPAGKFQLLFSAIKALFTLQGKSKQAATPANKGPKEVPVIILS